MQLYYASPPNVLACQENKSVGEEDEQEEANRITF